MVRRKFGWVLAVWTVGLRRTVAFVSPHGIPTGNAKQLCRGEKDMFMIAQNGLSTRSEMISLAASGISCAALGMVDPPAAEAASKGVEDVKRGLEADFDRQYYVTGDLTSSLYRPDCLFTDPTTRVTSVQKYTDAVKLLFDPENSKSELLSLIVEDDRHLLAEWRLQGYLKFPWHPFVAPYTGTTRYTLDGDGLISRHEETWSISALDAARASLTPTAGPPPGA